MDALRSVLPAGTLSGAPKVRAMQIIDELEPVKRGGYGGAIGYSQLRRRPRHRDPHPHGRRQGRRRARPGRRRHRRRRQARLRVRGVAWPRRAAVHARDRAGRRQPSGNGQRLDATERECGPRHRQLRLASPTTSSSTSASSAPRSRSVRNDRATVDELLASGYERCVVSPGPCTPDEAGISLEVVRRMPEAGVPTLGVCLGHQALAQAFGGTRRPAHAGARQGDDDRARRPHDLPRPASPLTVGRYHSLVVDPELPDCLRGSPRAAAAC